MSGFGLDDVKTVFFEVAKEKCQCCGKPLRFEDGAKADGGTWHAHHIVSRSVKEDHSISNMAILCDKEEDCHLNCAHNGSFPRHNHPRDWGRSHVMRRCWHKGEKGQCETELSTNNRKAFCIEHQSKELIEKEHAI